ncbi:MAG: hypothetical protein Kow0081_3180 [Candidatus Dojkabacteria bacterium]
MAIDIVAGPNNTSETPSWKERFLNVIPKNFLKLIDHFTNLLESETFHEFFDEQDKQRYFKLLQHFIDDKKTEQEILDFFFLPEEKLELENNNILRFSKIWGKHHATIYIQYINENLEAIIRKGIFVLNSCMYAGKTTFAFQLTDKLNEQGYEIQYLIADALGVEKITARALNREENALPFPKGVGDDFDSIFADRTNNPKKCIFLDEYTFVDSVEINSLIDYCNLNGILLILAGLDKTSNSESLIQPEVAEKLKDVDAMHYQCLAFLPDNTDFSDDEYPKPTGRFTQRFVQIKDKPKLFLRDIFLARHVIAKEHSFVIYCPSDKDQIYTMIKAGLQIPNHADLNKQKMEDHFKYMQQRFGVPV